MYEHSAILFGAMNYLLKKLNIYEQMITPHKDDITETRH